MQPSSTQRFSGIFISYRRDDAAGHAGRLADRLVEHFGRERIFMDIDTIEPGEDFVTVIENAVASCDILIAVIGRSWLSPGGSGRLDNPNDFVRLEIATALRRDIRVVPVLVQRANMPKPEDLPDDLDKLTRRNAVELSDSRWQTDVDELIGVMEKVLAKRAAGDESSSAATQTRQDTPATIVTSGTASPAHRRRLLMMIGGAALIVLLAVTILIWRSKTVQGSDNTNHAATPLPSVMKESTSAKATPTPESKHSPSPDAVPFAEPTLWTRDDSGTILRIVRDGNTVKATVVRPSDRAKSFGLEKGDLAFKGSYEAGTIRGKAYVRLDPKDRSKCPAFSGPQPFEMELTLSTDGKTMSGRRDDYRLSDDCKLTNPPERLDLRYTRISP